MRRQREHPSLAKACLAAMMAAGLALLMAPSAVAGPSTTNLLVHVDANNTHVVGEGENPLSNGDAIDVSVMSSNNCNGGGDGGDLIDIAVMGNEGCDSGDTIDVAILTRECGDTNDTLDINLLGPDNC